MSHERMHPETALLIIFQNIVPKCSGCWHWIGGHNDEGYGTKWGIKIHRLMWSLKNNRSPMKGMHICHTCDNPRCVNPDHLFEGTPKQNTKDRDFKGRTQKNENHYRSKLNWEAVEFIRSSNLPVVQLASKFGVDRRCIYKVLNRVTWK
jgi:hypothetical protein